MKTFFNTGLILLGSFVSTLIYGESNSLNGVIIEGRVAVNEDGGITMGYPGVTLHAAFNGAGLQLDLEALSEDLYLDVKIDDGAFYWIKLEEGTQTVEIKAEQAGAHQVEVVRRNETWQGMIKIASISAIDGELLEPDPLPSKKLMFIGDSITCGDCCDIREEGPHSRGFEHNGRLSYGYVISRMLDAQCHLVSYGGRGVIRDWQGIQTTNNVPQFYERTLADDESSRWQHPSYIADAVGICLGTNDFSSGIPDEHLFVTSYVELVRKIMRDAPDAKVFIIDSPMFGEDELKRSVLSYYLDQVVEKLADPDVLHLELGHFPGRPENAHPVASEHQQIAEILAPRFAETLGIAL